MLLCVLSLLQDDYHWQYTLHVRWVKLCLMWAPPYSVSVIHIDATLCPLPPSGRLPLTVHSAWKSCDDDYNWQYTLQELKFVPNDDYHWQYTLHEKVVIWQYTLHVRWVKLCLMWAPPYSVSVMHIDTALCPLPPSGRLQLTVYSARVKVCA
jgi:hypothetical protein